MRNPYFAALHQAGHFIYTVAHAHTEHGLPIGPKLEHLGRAIKQLAKAEQMMIEGDIFEEVLPAIGVLQEYEFLLPEVDIQSDIERLIAVANFILEH